MRVCSAEAARGQPLQLCRTAPGDLRSRPSLRSERRAGIGRLWVVADRPALRVSRHVRLRSPRMTRQILSEHRLVVCLVAVAAVASSGAAALTVGTVAEVTKSAVRGSQIQVSGTIPASSGCRRVAVIGDSLSDNSRPWLVSGLSEAGFTAVVDAQPSRRIPASVRAPYSGVTAATEVRATFGEADCWVVALGSNDLPYGGLDRVSVEAWFDEMLAAVTPGAHVWWVNVDYHHDPRWTFDFVRATSVFNNTLSERATEDPDLDLIDWHSLAEANLQWFFDPVHVDRTGSIARARQTVDALPRPR
jgi:hypothetical protein